MAIPTGTYGNKTIVTKPKGKRPSGGKAGPKKSPTGGQKGFKNPKNLGVFLGAKNGMGMGPGGPGGPGGGSSYGGGGGGGGGGSARAAEAAAEAARARQRSLIEQMYKQGVGHLNTNRGDALRALPGYHNEALRRLAEIYKQNQQQTKYYGGEISRETGAVNALLRQALGGLQGDLGGQGVDAQGLAAAAQSYEADAAARGGAASNFNNRLAQLMALGYGDQRSTAATVNQGAQSQIAAQYQAMLAQMQAERASALMGVA